MDTLLTATTVAWILLAAGLAGLAWYASGPGARQIPQRVKVRRD